MFGFMKPANKVSKQKSAEASDFDAELDNKQTPNPARRTSSEPVLVTPNDDYGRGGSSASSSHSSSAAARNRQKNGSLDSEDLDSMSVQELESYAVSKAEDTTSTVNNCLRIAEDIRQDATKTLDTLHQQGEQIHRTHMMAVEMDKDLSKGEKLLGNLGGMFSKPWKPKKTRDIKGPSIKPDDNLKEKPSDPEQKEKLVGGKGKSNSRTPPSEPTNAMQKIELEKSKQDDALSDLSNILGDLKGMAVDMGTELDRQNKALDELDGDIDELNARVKGAGARARRLAGK